MVPTGCPRTAPRAPAPRPRLLPARAGEPARAGCFPRPRGMAPSSATRRTAPRCAPRTRGDGPQVKGGLSEKPDCSPRRRGWTLSSPELQRWVKVLPAPAGMDPTALPAGRTGPPAPRSRGDGPETPDEYQDGQDCSRLARGGTRSVQRRRPGVALLSAPAGMDPTSSVFSSSSRPAPRARGDGPACPIGTTSTTFCSLPARGWTPHGADDPLPVGLLPARAGMDPTRPSRPSTPCAVPRARGDGPAMATTAGPGYACSPCPRGWTQDLDGPQESHHLLPAPVGMDPLSTVTPSGRGSVPCVGGDGPAPPWRDAELCCSPPARGWSQGSDGVVSRPVLLPARAGMAPTCTSYMCASCTAPRTRRDGPARSRRLPPKVPCSPRPRGWPLPDRQGAHLVPVLPAAAGMVPTATPLLPGPTRASRACGDGPRTGGQQGRERTASRARGWPLPHQARRAVRGLLPACAGLDPPPPTPTRVPPCASRACGDGPEKTGWSATFRNCSPRSRGWTH